MSYPQNPETIILKNIFYPKGLTEKDVYDYYIMHKNSIMQQVRNRDVMFAIMIDINKPVMRRKMNGRFIRLTNSNYEKIITGRTIAIYSTMGFYEDMAVVDIDAESFDKAKEATPEIYNELIKANFISRCEIKYTGKTGFHIMCYFSRKMQINDAKLMLERYLIGLPSITNKYTIAPKRTKGVPNIDLWASNKKSGAYITLHSLSIIGLKCMNIPINEMNNFKAKNAKI